MTYKMLLNSFKEKKPAKSRVPSGTQTMPDSNPAPRKLGYKSDYVPPWYKGERGAYESAMRARKEIGNLPKMR